MKKKNLIFYFAIFTSLSINAGSNPKWMKKARQAQVSVITYDDKGDMHESQGVFVDDKGSVITEFDVMKGATKATIVDFAGKEHEVTSICGANSMYNMVKLQLQLEPKEKIVFLEQASTEAQENEIVYILPNVRADKSVPASMDTIKQNNKFKEQYNYYTLSHLANERQSYSPVLNEKGLLLGLVQQPATDGKNSFVIDSHFGSDMRITAIDAGNTDLKAININKDLPQKEEDASSFIFLTGTQDTAAYLGYVDKFIKQFPQSAQGYMMKAEMLVDKGDYETAEKTYNDALAQDSVKKDEIHFSWSKKIYNLNLTPSYQTYNDWNLEKALSEAESAYSVNPLPLYQNQQGSCLYALKRYGEAYEKYYAVTKTNLRSPELFIYAAQCKQMAQAPIEEVLALQDSAVNCFTKPYPQSAANILLIRGTTLGQAGKYREAVADYNEYEHLMGAQLTSNFYYEREQMEIKCRMYPAALNDIERAIRLSPNEPVLYAELAALNYRVNQIDDAIAAAQQAIRLDEKFPDAYRIIGVCLNQQGKTAEAKKHLQKAVELGDTIAQGILDKIK
ncbi:MAG: tetratricopeptide repeat protein [Bacteroidaceae bacterium]|nr:tetratricopeptide repeat protein [Bacteroidaceae bacterium]